MKPTLHRLQETDISGLRALVELFAEVFERENFKVPSAEYLQGLLTNKSMVFIVASHKGEIIGGLSAHILPSVYEVRNELYIYDFAVKVNFQRQDVGRKVLSALQEYSRTANAKAIFVQADKEDDHALDFYRATGGREAEVFHYTFDC